MPAATGSPTPEEEGTPAGYLRYRSAVQAWSDSPRSSETYFGPGCSDELASALDACRQGRSKVRLVLGDTLTGNTSFNEARVVGHIGRSRGALKFPLLEEGSQAFGSPIPCDRVLAILDWETGLPLYRHASYRPPELQLEFSEHERRPWSVVHRGSAIARFADIGKAGAYIAFMRGASVDPRAFR